MKKITSGVYFLYDGDELVYIGESENIFYRIGTHIKEEVKDFDHWTFIETETYKERKQLESFLINIFKPKYNVTSVNSFNESRYLGDYFLDDEIKATIDIYETFYSYVDLAWIEDVLKIDGSAFLKWFEYGDIPNDVVNQELNTFRIKRQWVIDNVEMLLKMKKDDEEQTFKARCSCAEAIEEMLK